MSEKIIVAGVCAFLLIREYKESSGRFILAKIFHFISIIAIIIYHMDAPKTIVLLLKNFHTVIGIWGEGLSKTEVAIAYINHVAYLICSVFLIIYSVGLIARREDCRKIIVKFVFVFIPIGAISVYMLARKHHPDQLFIYVSLVTCMLFITYWSISFLYKRKFMIEFFNSKNLAI